MLFSISQTVNETSAGIVGFITIVGSIIGLYLRFKRKLKFKNCKIIVKEERINEIKFILKNRSRMPASITAIGYKIKKDKALYFFPSISIGFDHQILGKKKRDVSFTPRGNFESQSLTKNMKSEISYLFIEQEPGITYKYRIIRFLKIELKESNLLK